MAATAWPFGLEHFSHEQNLWWPIVIGAALLTLYGAVSGLAFAGLADRVFALESPVSSLVGRCRVWGFVSFMLFWYMLLPIAREGAPFRATAADPTLFVGTELGLDPRLHAARPRDGRGLRRASLDQPRRARRPVSKNEDEFGRKLQHAA